MRNGPNFFYRLPIVDDLAKCRRQIIKDFFANQEICKNFANSLTFCLSYCINKLHKELKNEHSDANQGIDITENPRNMKSVSQAKVLDFEVIFKF